MSRIRKLSVAMGVAACTTALALPSVAGAGVVDDVVGGVSDTVNGLLGGGGAQPAPAPAPAPSKSRRGLAVLLALLVIGAGVVAAILVLQSSPQEPVDVQTIDAQDFSEQIDGLRELIEQNTE